MPVDVGFIFFHQSSRKCIFFSLLYFTKWKVRPVFRVGRMLNYHMSGVWKPQSLLQLLLKLLGVLPHISIGLGEEPMFIVNWDILKFCSQWIRMMCLNCCRGLLHAGCNSREPLFTGGKKFCIPCTVRISTEVNEIFPWVRINTCNQSKWFSEKHAHYWSACWLCSCIFCHVDLKGYPILVGFSYLCPLTDGHFTASTYYYCLSYKECLCEKKEQKRFNWIISQILVDSKDAVKSSLHFLLLSAENVVVVQEPQCTCKFVHARDPSFWTVRTSGYCFPFEHPSKVSYSLVPSTFHV